MSDVKLDAKDYKHNYTKVELVIPENKPEFADVELNFSKVELNRVTCEHDFYDFGLNSCNSNDYNQIINFKNH